MALRCASFAVAALGTSTNTGKIMLEVVLLIVHERALLTTAAAAAVPVDWDRHAIF